MSSCMLPMLGMDHASIDEADDVVINVAVHEVNVAPCNVAMHEAEDVVFSVAVHEVDDALLG